MSSKTQILLGFDEMEWKVIENALLTYSINKYQSFIDSQDQQALRFAQIASGIADDIKNSIEESLDDPWKVG